MNVNSLRKCLANVNSFESTTSIITKINFMCITICGKCNKNISWGFDKACR